MNSPLSKSEIDKTYGSYIRSKSNCIPDPDVVSMIDQYRENVLKQFRSIYPDKLRQMNFGENIFASIKVYGASAFGVYDKFAESTKKVYFCNTPYHRIWLGLKANRILEELMDKYFSNKMEKLEKNNNNNISKKIIFAGELFAAPITEFFDGIKNIKNIDFEGRSRINDFMHCQRNPNSQEDLDRIGSKVFDIVLSPSRFENCRFHLIAAAI